MPANSSRLVANTSVSGSRTSMNSPTAWNTPLKIANAECTASVLSPFSTSNTTCQGPPFPRCSNDTVTLIESTTNDATARDKPERSHVNGTFELKDSAMNSASDCIVRTPAQSSHAAGLLPTCQHTSAPSLA